MGNYMDVSAAVRDLLELAEAGLSAGQVNPVLTRDGERLSILFVPGEMEEDSPLLELEQRSSGRLWVHLRTAEGEPIDSWCETELGTGAYRTYLHVLWKMARDMRVTSDTEEGLAKLESLFRRLRRPRRAG